MSGIYIKYTCIIYAIDDVTFNLKYIIDRLNNNSLLFTKLILQYLLNKTLPALPLKAITFSWYRKKYTKTESKCI